MKNIMFGAKTIHEKSISEIEKISMDENILHQFNLEADILYIPSHPGFKRMSYPAQNRIWIEIDKILLKIAKRKKS